MTTAEASTVPQATDHTVEKPAWLYLPHVVESARDVSRSVGLVHRVNQQDFDAVEQCQSALDSHHYSTGAALAPSEHPRRAIHGWLRGRFAE